MMAWSMQDESPGTTLRFVVDAGSADRTEHLHEYLETVQDSRRWRGRLGVASPPPFTRAAVARAARLSAQDFARRFIAGENARQVLRAAKKERGLRRGFTLDILGEAVISEVEAERYFRAYIDLLEAVTPEVQSWPADSLIDEDARAPIPRVNLSVKLSALDSQFDALDHEGTTRRRRSLKNCSAPAGWGRSSMDMESYDKKD